MNEKIHYRYVIAMLTAVVVALLTRKWAENDAIVAYISFASTIASLLLAIIAIVYSFLSNNSFSSSAAKIEIAAETVRKETEKLNSSLSGFDSIIRQIPESIKNVESKIQETHEAVRASAQQNGTLPRPDRQFAVDLMNFFLSRSSWNGIKVLYICTLSAQKNREFNLRTLCEADKFISFDYAYAYIVASASIGFFVYTGKEDLFTANGVMPELIPALKGRIDEIVAEGKISPSESLKQEVDAIDKYFE